MEKCVICGAESEITGDNIIKDCCTDCSAKLSVLEQGNDGESYQSVLQWGMKMLMLESTPQQAKELIFNKIKIGEEILNRNAAKCENEREHTTDSIQTLNNAVTAVEPLQPNTPVNQNPTAVKGLGFKAAVILTTMFLIIGMIAGTVWFIDNNGKDRGKKASETVTQKEEEDDLNSLSYEMREETFEAKNSEGVIFQTATVSYPYFESECETAKALNAKYEDYISELSFLYGKNPDEMDTWYDEMGCDEAMSLPLYENLDATVKYNDKGYISIYEGKEIFEGGYSGYYEYDVVNYNIKKCKELTAEDAIDGSGEEDKEVILYNIVEQKGNFDEYLFSGVYGSKFNFTDAGVTFYWTVGDRFAPDEFTIAYNKSKTPVISADKTLSSVISGEMTTEKAEKLWKVANMQHNIWMWAWGHKIGYSYSGEYMEHIRVAHSDIKTTDDLKSHLSKYFDSEICRDMIEYFYYFYDDSGNLCCAGMAEPRWDNKTFRSLSIVSAGTENMTVSVEFSENGMTTYEEYTLEKSGDRWIFTGSFKGDYDDLS